MTLRQLLFSVVTDGHETGKKGWAAWSGDPADSAGGRDNEQNASLLWRGRPARPELGATGTPDERLREFPEQTGMMSGLSKGDLANLDAPLSAIKDKVDAFPSQLSG